ncbi:type IV pili twitching motility protein PilT [[Phormidium ambiguum] IAM M-71]|uniref:Type IV pili twitching motility protein PilT n=1 Tax=[Phormidium ambiguum] IAM M-71 TaxID=454136 RepID=A0A1U7I8P4_9CYAN|nr:type IV pilus twitching motility protein PilT [Phormidium ambiguum]OKH32852.1 type IV pili twitching motility protein PilT [Phormidium ambiguum IAM M-71]
MFKIIKAPSVPVPPLQRFSVLGTADTIHAGKPLILVIDNQFKVTTPPISSEGTWRFDLALHQPGKHQLAILLDNERLELSVQVGTNLHAETEVVSPPNTQPISNYQSNTISLEKLVREAHEKGYSDVHLCVGKAPRFRNRGEMEISNYPVTDETTFINWLKEILTESEIKQFQETLDFDGAAGYDFARVRVNIFKTMKGSAMVLRLIPLRIPTIDQLGLPGVFQTICHYHKGLVLVTGPTGSGKSTTLAAMVDFINRTMKRHIITIEDPIEFVHEDHKSVISQREVGIHTVEFDRALKAALREDPDVILIGEMRDRSTVNTALKAAQTGHLVFGTLHTNSAIKTIERILNLYEPDEQEPMLTQLSESLAAIIAQSLLRTTDGRRAPIHDILINTDTVKDYIKRGEVEETESIMKKGNYDGMCTMLQSIYNLYLEGRITEETAMEASDKPNEMRILLSGGEI